VVSVTRPAHLDTLISLRYSLGVNPRYGLSLSVALYRFLEFSSTFDRRSYRIDDREATDLAHKLFYSPYVGILHRILPGDLCSSLLRGEMFSNSLDKDESKTPVFSQTG
jgi:hypothetical protein